MSLYDDDSWDQEEGEEEDEETLPEYSTYKDHVIILIDARPPMFQPDITGKVPFQTALELTMQLMKRKVTSTTGDKISVCFFGVSKTHGKECERNRHEFKPLGQPYAKDIRELDNLVKTEDLVGDLELQSADEKDESLTMTLRDCSRILQAEKESYKRIWLFTTEDHPSQGDKLAKAVEDAREAKVQIQLWFFSQKGKPFDETFYNQILSKGVEAEYEEDYGRAEDNMFDASGPLDEVKQAARRRDYRKRRYSKIPFTIPSEPPMTFDVALYKMHAVARKPTAVDINITDNSRIIRKSTFLAAQTGEKLAPTQLTYYVELGTGERVYFPKRDDYPPNVPVLSETDRGITLLMFLPRASLDWSHQIKPPTFVYPDEQDLKGGRVAFASLLQAMLDKDCIALVRYSRKASAPRLAVLVPQDEQVDEEMGQIAPPGMQLLILPFVDDMRDIPLPPPVEVPTEAVDLARRLVKGITIEDFEVGTMANPVLQKHYAMVEAHALSEEKCWWNEDKDDETMPDVGRMQEDWGDDIRQLDAACRFKDDAPAGSSTKKRSAAGDGGSSSTAKRVKKEMDGEITEETIRNHVDSGELLKCTVPQLKEMCRVLKLVVGGNKSQLIERIQEHMV